MRQLASRKVYTVWAEVGVHVTGHSLFVLHCAHEGFMMKLFYSTIGCPFYPSIEQNHLFQIKEHPFQGTSGQKRIQNINLQDPQTTSHTRRIV